MMRPTHAHLSRSSVGLRLCLAAAVAACGGVSTDGNENPPPTLTAVAPVIGAAAGGATITLTGTGFVANDAGDNHVVVGGVAAAGVSAVDDSTLTFTLPPEPTSGPTVDLLVFNANGFAELPDAFSYNPLPAITAIGPVLAPPGATLTVTGTGFQDLAAGENRVLVGGVEAPGVEVVSDTELTAEIPARGDAPAFTPLDVAVENDNGAAALPAAFRFTKPGILLATNGQLGAPTLHFLDLDVEPVQSTQIAVLDDRVSGMALSPDGGTVYVATNATTGGNRLGVLDPLTGHIDFVGFLRDEPTTADRVKDLAFVGNTAYVFLKAASRLATVNLTTGRYTIVGAPLVAPLAGAIGIIRRDASSVFVLNRLDGPLRFMDTASSLPTDGPLLGITSTAGVHAMMSEGESLLVITRENAVSNDINTPSLLRINPTTGAVAILGTVPTGSAAMIPTPPSFEPLNRVNLHAPAN